MKRFQCSRYTLLSRIILFLTVFGAAFLLQMGIGQYQSRYIMRPMEERTEDIQTISQFLDSVEGCMSVLGEYRWDYGDVDALINNLRNHLSAASRHIGNIHAEIREVSEEYYLLANAVRTTYEGLNSIVNEITLCLADDRSVDASQIYYDRATPCGTYLLQYTRQLLEQAIHDNHDAFAALEVTNSRMERLRSLVTVLSVAAACVMVVSLIFLLRSVLQLSRASEQISRGQLDVPDVDESRKDEMGHLAKTFNEMKRSMRRQVELLNKNNEMERELHTKETEALELQALVEREKLQQLRSQINPHFLFNTLNVIMYNARQESAEKTCALLDSLSQMFRYALGDNEALAPLSREVQIVNEFYSLYHARFGDRIQLQWHIDPEIELTETLLPAFLIQPLVENAFQHGLAPKEEGGKVDVEITIRDGFLRISVRDNGVGMTQQALEQLKEHLHSPSPTGEHIGVYNVAARLRLAGDAYGLEIRSEPDVGTDAVMRLPLVTVEEKEANEDETADCG